MTEDDLREVNGLVALHGRGRKRAGFSSETLFAIERRLLKLCGLKLEYEVGAPDPHAPPGGTSLALKAA